MREQLILPEPIEPGTVRVSSRNTRRRAGVFLSAGLSLALISPALASCSGESTAEAANAKASTGTSGPVEPGGEGGAGASPVPIQPTTVPPSLQETSPSPDPTTDSPAQPSTAPSTAGNKSGPLSVECDGFTKETANGFVTLTPQVTVSGSTAGKTINTVVNSWGPEGDNLYMGRGVGAGVKVPERIYAGAVVTGVTVVIFAPGQAPDSDHFTTPLASFGVPESNVIPCGVPDAG